MKRRFLKKSIYGLLLALLLTLLGGCAASGGEEAPENTPGSGGIGKPLPEYSAADDVFSLSCSLRDSMNPISRTTTSNAILAGLVYETLFTVAADYSFTPTRLVKDYSTPDGGKTWVITIDTSVQFSDGRNLRASDVSYSIRRAMQSTLFQPRLDNYSVVYGASSYGEDSMLITLYKEDMLFPALLTVPIIPEGEYNSRCPLGTGLYMVEDPSLWTPVAEEPDETDEEGETAAKTPRLVVNPYHPDAGRAPLAEIPLRDCTVMEELIEAFEDGLIDLVVNDPTGISGMGFGSGNEVRSYISPSMYYLGFNMERAFVMTAQYRYAISYLVDRTTIVHKFMLDKGMEAVCPIVPTSPLYDESIADVIRFSPKTALTMLERGGCADHDDDGKLEFMLTGIPMEIDIDFVVYNGNSVKLAAARRIADDLRDVGISVTMRELPWNDYVKALEDGDFDMYFGEIMLSADFDLGPLLTEEGSLNYGRVADPGYAERIATFLAADDAHRQAACRDLCQYVVANSPIVPIAFEGRDVITHRGVASGIELSPYNVFLNFADWTIKTN